MLTKLGVKRTWVLWVIPFLGGLCNGLAGFPLWGSVAVLCLAVVCGILTPPPEKGALAVIDILVTLPLASKVKAIDIVKAVKARLDGGFVGESVPTWAWGERCRPAHGVSSNAWLSVKLPGDGPLAIVMTMIADEIERRLYENSGDGDSDGAAAVGG